MNILFGRVGREDEEIAALIDSSNSALGAIAEQDLDVQRATGLLGPTLRETRIALGETNELAGVLGPDAQRPAPVRPPPEAGQRVPRAAGAHHHRRRQVEDQAFRAGGAQARA